MNVRRPPGVAAQTRARSDSRSRARSALLVHGTDLAAAWPHGHACCRCFSFVPRKRPRWDERVRPPSARGERPLLRLPNGARDLPRPGAGPRATGAAVRRARAAGLPALRDPRPRLRARALRRLRARPGRRLLVQGRWLLPFVWRPAHGRHGRAPGGPRPARGPGAAVGALAAIRAPLPARLRCSAHECRAGCLRADGLRLPPPPGAQAVGCCPRPVRRGHLRAATTAAP